MSQGTDQKSYFHNAASIFFPETIFDRSLSESTIYSVPTLNGHLNHEPEPLALNVETNQETFLLVNQTRKVPAYWETSQICHFSMNSVCAVKTWLFPMSHTCSQTFLVVQ